MITNATSHRHQTTVRGWVCVAAAMLLLTPAAQAQSEDSDKSEIAAIYRKGKTAYDLGDFQEAIRHFKQAYSMSPHEAYLYNIAQAYRQDGDCRNALFFYKRYVTVGGAEARHHGVVQRRIKELTESCQLIDDMKNEPPLGSMDPDKDEPGGDGQVTQGAEDSGEIAAGPRDTGAGDEPAAGVAGSGAATSSPVVTGALELGPAFLDVGELQVVGAHFSLVFSAGYPVDLGKLGLSVGGLFTYTPVQWSNEQLQRTGTSTLTSLLLNLGARYQVLDELAVRGEVGVGALILSGLSEGSVFVAPDTMASGAIGLLNLRVGIGAEYRLTENLTLSASPLVFSYSGDQEDLNQGVDGFVRFELLAGLGYRL